MLFFHSLYLGEIRAGTILRRGLLFENELQFGPENKEQLEFREPVDTQSQYLDGK
jgi:hypothetical protein